MLAAGSILVPPLLPGTAEEQPLRTTLQNKHTSLTEEEGLPCEYTGINLPQKSCYLGLSYAVWHPGVTRDAWHHHRQHVSTPEKGHDPERAL